MVQIIGTQVACADGLKDSWRHTATWAAGRLEDLFGDGVIVEYFDLFDPSCPHLPPDAQLPLVLIDGEVLSSGGKIPMPAIRKKLEALGVHLYGGESVEP
ncbi:MAG: hypothetical protein IT323_13705 [Anaerolineae bacterium]|nr:hypothetical protein [Anaerolineae bacterium]